MIDMRKMTAILKILTFTLLSIFSTFSYSQSWPTKQVIKWIVPFPPGGPADLTARQIAPLLSERLGQSVVIDNRPGGNSNIGFEAGSKATPDGYTMLFVVAGFVTNPHLYKLSWDPLKDFVPVVQLNQLQIMLLASSRFQPKNLTEVVDHIKNNPGKVKCAWGGSILLALGCENFKVEGKMDLTVVPYKGSAPAMNDLMGGHVDLMIEVMNTAVPQIKAGNVKPIAVLNTTKGRLPFPELPTLNEVMPGFEMIPWQGIVMPAGTPREITDRINKEISLVLQSQTMKQKYQETGLDFFPMSPDQFGQILQRDHAKYGKLIKSSNFKID
jgi:tripartite-type tricarboxylate transporter receptor subunit TctC